MDSAMKTNEQNRSTRSFGHLKNKTLTTLGMGSLKDSIFKIILALVATAMLVTFVFFHPIYLKTGTPMFGYGISMLLLPPVYLVWALWKLVSVYLLRMRP